MRREDYMFCIGYQGNAAIIDGEAKKKYAKASIKQLIEAGMFRAALCAAVFDQDNEGLEDVLESYNKLAGTSLQTQEDAMRLWGGIQPTAATEKTMIIK